MLMSMRPVIPRLDFTAPRRGSSIRLRPRHVFHVQRLLSHNGKEETKAEEFWIPRKPTSYWGRIRWIAFHVPILPIGLVNIIRLCVYRCWRDWNLPIVYKGVKVDTRAVRLTHDFVDGCAKLLRVMMIPWGVFLQSGGCSMEPTLPTQRGWIYISFAYIDKRDVRRGDVVAARTPKPYDHESPLLCKRVAALEGERVRVTKHEAWMKPFTRVVDVRYSHNVSLLRNVFTYGHYRYRSDTAFCSGIMLQCLVTQGHLVRFRLNLFLAKCNGDGPEKGVPG